MRIESSGAATAATAPIRTHTSPYALGSAGSSTIDDVLTTLVFGLASRHHKSSERMLVASKINRLLRRRIELNPVGDVRHGS